MRHLTVVVIICQIFHLYGEVTSPSCYLPSGQAGLCVPLVECAHLSALIENLQKPLAQEVSLFIRDSFFCGYSGKTITVCCPLDGLKVPNIHAPRMAPREECGLQNDQHAECTALSKCTPFRKMMINLRKPLPPAVPSIMKSSYLCGVEQVNGKTEHKVCCPGETSTTTDTPLTSSTTASMPANSSTVPSSSNESSDVIQNSNITTSQNDKEKYRSHPGRSFLSSPESCGLSKLVPRGRVEKIVGGKSAKLGQFPWLVNLGYEEDGKNGTVFKCGGSLVGTKYVLTAGHCVKNLPGGFKLSMVRVGEHDLASEEDCNVQGNICSHPPQDIKVEEVVLHQSFGKPSTLQNDIAIIKLKNSVILNDFVTPICLPFDRTDNPDDMDDQAMFVAGWGATTRQGRRRSMLLQFVEMPEFSYEECRDIYNKTGMTLNETVICAGGKAGEDSCLGDSGSGLMRQEAEKYQLVGVVSAGPKLCGTEGVPGVYTSVGSYLDWILDTVSALEDKTISGPDSLVVGERIDNSGGSSSELSHPGRKLLSNDSTCGIAHATMFCTAMRIVGGNDAELGQYPWLVNLGFSSGRRPGTLYKCGGTLIGASYVLTAAHCVTQLPRGFGLVTVIVGEHDLDSDEDCSDDCDLCSEDPQNFDVEKVVFHPMYGKPKPFQNDIAVIKLARDVVQNDFVNPVCLPYADTNEDYSTNTVAGAAVLTTVAGWGATTSTGRNPATVLQYLAVNVTNSQKCHNIYEERGGQLTDKQICAGGTPGKDSCVGDSGSGLMRDIMNQDDFFPRSYLIGVVSFGPRLCGTKGVPGVYTRVNSYLGWILDTVWEMERN